MVQWDLTSDNEDADSSTSSEFSSSFSPFAKDQKADNAAPVVEGLTIRNLDTGEAFDALEEETKLNTLLGHLTTDAPIVSMSDVSFVEDDNSSVNTDGTRKHKAHWKGRNIMKYLKNAVGTGDGSHRSQDSGSAGEHDGPRKSSTKVASNNKDRDYKQKLKNVKFVQCLQFHEGPIWTVKFSYNSMFCASAGKDSKVAVWRVMPKEEISAKRKDTTIPPSCSCSVQDFCCCQQGIIAQTPWRVFVGHEQDVVSLAWSRTNFLASGGTDCTVRLWHVTKQECLVILKHRDIITCIAFHPSNDSILLSGSFDKKLRMWVVPTGRVLHWQVTPQLITAASFMAQGSMVVAGFLNGQCTFFNYSTEEGFQFNTEIDCRNRRVSHKKGKKVSGIKVIEKLDKSSGPGTKNFKRKEFVLVTTNDSRIRLFETDGFACIFKFKGLVNNNLQICADGTPENVLCASEDRNVYLWNYDLAGKLAGSSKRHSGTITTKCSVHEVFASHRASVSCAIFVPKKAVDIALGTIEGETEQESRVMLMSAGMDGHIHMFVED